MAKTILCAVAALSAAAVCRASPSFVVPLHEVRGRESGGDGHSVNNYFTFRLQLEGNDFSVRIDTTSNQLVVPGSAAHFDANKEHSAYSPSTANPIGCHSLECVAIKNTANPTYVPTICRKKDIKGGWECPAAADSASGQAGVGVCETHPGAASGPVTACADHLNPSCGTVLGYGYTCTQDMGIFGAALKGKLLSSFCPESCHTCPAASGPTRYCTDNTKWKDGDGYGCSDYTDPTLQGKCFSTAAYIACPVTCGACGDCCDSTSGCFFKTTFNDGSAVSGTKYTGDVTIADAVVGSRVAPQTATGVFGVISYAETHFEPNTEIDGVWGLSVGETCNPACSNNTLDSFFSSDGGDNMKIGLCLAKDEGSPSSMDIGFENSAHFAGSIFHIPLDPSGVANNIYMTGGPTGFQVGHSPVSGVSSFKTIFDVNTKWLLFPEIMYQQFKTTLQNVAPKITKDGKITSDAMFNAGCAGPIPDSVSWQAALPTLQFTFTDKDGQAAIIRLDAKAYTLPVTLGGKTMICSAVKGYKGNNIILGQHVMRSKYWVLDRTPGFETIGFAKQGNCGAMTKGNQASCRADEWKCGNDACIPKVNLKDGIFDCLDGSDEPSKGPPPPPPTCPPLANGGVVPHGKLKLSAGADYGKLVVLHCASGYKPSGDQVVYCNADRAPEWEKPFSTCVPDTGGAPSGGGGGSCTEKKTNGMSCLSLLKNVGKCRSKPCKQSDCDWAHNNYRFDCKCTCSASAGGGGGGGDKCAALTAKVATACGSGGNVFGCPNKDLKVTNCGKGKCKSDECGDGHSCTPSTNGQCPTGSVFCKPCNVCALPCTMLIIDQLAEMSKCKISLPGSWGRYAGTLNMICHA